MSINEEDKEIKVRNVSISQEQREKYKYVIVREYNGEYWFYDFANSLSMATRICVELKNGLVYEIDKCK